MNNLGARSSIGFLTAACFIPAALMAGGCHSYRIDATVENRTGAAITQLEVDYPSASFGANSLAPDTVFHYRFQVRGSGPMTVQYTASDGRQVRVTGPTLHEKQEGRLDIVLPPGGKAAFHVELQPQN
jgi:hypothetical protein